MTDEVTIVGVAGSLRTGSYNKALIATAAQFMPSSVRYIQADIQDVPLFSQEYEPDDIPESVQNLSAQISGAHAILLSTPEYNHSFSGVMKNVLDWLSRGSVGNPLQGKQAAVMGASDGGFGAARAIKDLIALVPVLQMQMMPRGEFPVSKADTLIKDGLVVDAHTLEKMEAFLKKFVSFVQKQAE